MMLMFFMIVIVGICIIIINGLKCCEIFIVVIFLGLGFGVFYDFEIFKILLVFIYVLVENFICVGGLIVILLNIIFFGGYW